MYQNYSVSLRVIVVPAACTQVQSALSRIAKWQPAAPDSGESVGASPESFWFMSASTARNLMLRQERK